MSMSTLTSKRKRSAVWSYFDREENEVNPTCSICGESVKSCGNTSNQLKHLKSKHVTEFKIVQEEREREALRLAEQAPSTSGRQVTLAAAIERTQAYGKESVRRRKIDEALVNMLAIDLQPASIVEDSGFLKFLQVLDPKYHPPSRRTIMRSLLPAQHEVIGQKLKDRLADTKFCALTTDLWTSRASEGYITVTCHFLSSEWELYSSVLGTLHINESHTAEVIAAELMSITDNWGITDKVVCVVTDNANNIVAAVRLNGWKHLPCFAHTLNLVVQDSLKADTELAEIQKKCRDIVSYFHRSSKATDKLVAIQTRLKIENHKLIQDVETRWNSVFYMFERMIEQHEAVTTTLCLLDRNSLCLRTEDIEKMKNAVAILKHFEAATREMSADQYFTVSKLIPIARSLQQLTAGARTTTTLGDELCLQMRRRFLNMEAHHMLAASTLLDPRFKKLGFVDMGAAEQCTRRFTDEIAGEVPGGMEETSEGTQRAEERSTEGLWHAFDQHVAEVMTKRTSTSDAVIEMRQYIQHKMIERKECPILWWKENSHHYPRMQLLAKKYLCIPATSVPSERLFSKAGQLVSARRSRLKPKHVNTYLFLNKNM